jgi:hypothetical protein
LRNDCNLTESQVARRRPSQRYLTLREPDRITRILEQFLVDVAPPLR